LTGSADGPTFLEFLFLGFRQHLNHAKTEPNNVPIALGMPMPRAILSAVDNPPPPPPPVPNCDPLAELKVLLLSLVAVSLSTTTPKSAGANLSASTPSSQRRISAVRPGPGNVSVGRGLACDQKKENYCKNRQVLHRNSVVVRWFFNAVRIADCAFAGFLRIVYAGYLTGRWKSAVTFFSVLSLRFFLSLSGFQAFWQRSCGPARS